MRRSDSDPQHDDTARMDQRPLREKEVIRSRIAGNVEAAKQFLVVAIGLGLTNSISEKLKFATESAAGSTQHLMDASVDDPFVSLRSFVLLVFGVYAVRFFFNNYIYLHQSYDEHRLNELGERELRPLIFSSGLDLGLSIFTGIMMSIICMTLSENRLRYLLGFLVLHYLVDAIVLRFNVVTRKQETSYRRERNKVNFWLLSNVTFVFVYSVLYLLDARYIDVTATEALLFKWTMALWLANSVINLGITYLFRERAIQEEINQDQTDASGERLGAGADG